LFLMKNGKKGHLMVDNYQKECFINEKLDNMIKNEKLYKLEGKKYFKTH